MRMASSDKLANLSYLSEMFSSRGDFLIFDPWVF
jgi:hypothetical protein